MTIRETIMEVVARRADQVFLVDAVTSREITYGEFHRQACALAAELRPARRAKGRSGRSHGSELLRTGGPLFRLHLSWCSHRAHQSSTEQGRRPIHSGELQARTRGGKRNLRWRNQRFSRERAGSGNRAGSYCRTRTTQAPLRLTLSPTPANSCLLKPQPERIWWSLCTPRAPPPSPRGWRIELGRMFRNAAAFARLKESIRIPGFI